MIGFKLQATSNTSYQRSYSSWTEGEMWLAKGLQLTAGLPDPGELAMEEGLSMALPGPEDLIEPAFRHIFRGLLLKLSNIGHKIGVNITGEGDTYHTYYFFNPEMGGRLMVKVFLHHLRWASDAYQRELGDQVMIHICKTIVDFDDHLAIHSPGKVGLLWITLYF